MLVGIDWNSFRKGNLYNAPHVVVFFTVWTHCTLMQKVLCQSFSLLYLVKKKKKKWKHRSSAWTLRMFLIANSVFKYCISTPPPSDSRTHHPPALYFSLDLGTFQVAVHMNGLTGCHGSCTADTVRLTDISVPARHRHIDVVMTTLLTARLPLKNHRSL